MSTSRTDRSKKSSLLRQQAQQQQEEEQELSKAAASGDASVAASLQEPEGPASADFDVQKPLRPVFYDERRRRWPWFKRAVATGFFLFGIGVILLIVSLFALRLMPRVPLPRVNQDKDLGNLEPALADHERRKQAFIQKRNEQQRQQDVQKLRQAEVQHQQRLRERREKAEAFVRARRHPVAAEVQNTTPVVAGFYVNWEQAAYISTRRHIDSLTHFIPEWLHLKPAGSNYTDPSPNNKPFFDGRTKTDKEDITPFVQAHNVPILPILNNYARKNGEDANGYFDTNEVHEIVSDPRARANVITQLRRWLIQERMQGINIDFEQVAAADRDDLTQFMKELHDALHPLGMLVTQDVELEAEGFDLKALAEVNDWIVPMFYDEHDGGMEPGPVAGIDWTRRDLKEMLETQKVPANKIVMGVGNHAYDWREGGRDAADLTYQSAIITAKESEPDSAIHLDAKSLNPMFQYTETVEDKNGKSREESHTVWMQDAVSVFNQLQLAKPKGIRGGALWFVGSEDPSMWAFFDRSAWKSDWGRLIDSGALNTIAYGGQGEVNFEGEGELLQPQAKPSIGKRTVKRDLKTGLITSAAYVKDAKTGDYALPLSYVLRRYGGTVDNVKKQIVLSFDDGPDADWTPKILDILKEYHVPAVFFVVGKQAESNQELLRRIWDEGHEIGNHSWSHPDLFKLSPELQKLQLTATQRVIEAVTDHSTMLFRPPYGGDTEPQTGNEVVPMDVAGELGYITVGEKNDPQDWRLYDLKPGSDTIQDTSKPRDYHDIVKSVVVNRDVGSIVLLHDAGGDRSRTLEALPEIIKQLRAKGYTFVSVSQLRGVTREKFMPPVTGNNKILVGADKYVFEVTYMVQRTLTTLFMLSIVLGGTRVALFVGLALIQRFREKRRVFPAGFTPAVSVIIAAYNEEKVITRTVQTLLDCDYPNLEIIVVDDGSKDNTSQVVQDKFGEYGSVRLLRKENGGKATALNRGILAAHGEIIISLDADTLFTADTITRLTRHFADPKVGAVSGNVRVGNAHNLFVHWKGLEDSELRWLPRLWKAAQAALLTRWQALEYTTSQNFDRRGYDLLNCITVVPGAVGALRRSAVMEVGGYTHDTLAEDTDLTWKLRRAKWRIVNDNSAMAYTEAPETLMNLAKQRFRWAFGTLQCLWKHQAALGQHGAFGWIALPSLWLYQILFPAISPFMDVAMIWALFAGNFAQFAAYFLAMFAMELVAAAIAIRMDRGNMRLLPWLFFQRFIYRQLMYYVILKSLLAAIRGSAVGWGKFERTGKARIEGAAH